MAEGFTEWEMVDDGFSVPHREGSPPMINPESEVQENDSATAPPSPVHSKRSPVLDNSDEIFKRFWKYCWIRKLAARVWDSACLRSGIGSVTAMLAAALLWLAAARVQRRVVQERSRLVLLITEKDQKITQLLVDIGKINELLMARRKVTVLQMGKSPRLIT